MVFLQPLIYLIILYLIHQEKKFIDSIRQHEVPLHKYMAMMELEVPNPRILQTFFGLK